MMYAPFFFLPFYRKFSKHTDFESKESIITLITPKTSTQLLTLYMGE